jgi:hypothetical protein
MATGYIMVDTPNLRTPQGGYPRRGGWQPSGTCIVHTSEGNWQAGVDALTNLVRTRADYGCYHQGCDWKKIAKYYPWLWETWQDSETNNWAVGISAACKTSDWGNMPADVEEGYYRNMAHMGAEFVRYMRDNFGINVPLVRISGAEARAAKPGFCAHGDSGIARSDPGARFDWARFFRYMRENLTGVVTPGGTTGDEDDKMLIIAKQKDSDAVFIGDGVTRRHIPDPGTLADIQWLGRNGWLNIVHNSDVQTLERIEAIGREIDYGAIADTVLNRPIAWYGFDGNRPAGGRRDTTPGLDMGWSDARHADTARRIKGLEDKIDALASRPVAEIDLTEADIQSLTNQLKQVLPPALAADLARRLAE